MTCSPPDRVSVLQATYGANCGPARSLDATGDVAAWCKTHTSSSTGGCEFLVCACSSALQCSPQSPPCLPDPASGCEKEFTALWTCDGDVPGQNRSLSIPPEADGFLADLSCADADAV